MYGSEKKELSKHFYSYDDISLEECKLFLSKSRKSAAVVDSFRTSDGSVYSGRLEINHEERIIKVIHVEVVEKKVNGIIMQGEHYNELVSLDYSGKPFNVITDPARGTILLGDGVIMSFNEQASYNVVLVTLKYLDILANCENKRIPHNLSIDMSIGKIKFLDRLFDEIDFDGIDTLQTVSKVVYESKERLINRLLKFKQEMDEHRFPNDFHIELAFYSDIDDDYHQAYDLNLLLEEFEFEGMEIAPDKRYFDEYGKQTAAYKKLQNLRKYMINTVKEIVQDREARISLKQNKAWNDAGSTIKGVGFGIITNSFVDLMIYNFMSNSALKSQAKKADKMFQRDNYEIVTGEYRSARENIEYLLDNVCLPGCKDCIDLWAMEVTKKRLDYEVLHGMDEHILSYDLVASQNCLNKLDNVSDVETIEKELYRAFELCPYNKEIYYIAARHGLLNEETVDLYKWLYYFDDKLLDIVVDFCLTNARDNDKIETQLQLVKSFGNDSQIKKLADII